MKRIWLMIIKLFYLLPYYFCRLNYIAKHAEELPEEEKYEFYHKAVIKANKAGRITVDCHGLENLPKENGYILFPNHQGLFDGLILLETHERPFGTTHKKEIDDHYFLKRFRLGLGGILIDREDVRQAMKAIGEVAKQVQQGRNFALFAEGTRTKNPNKIGEFKAGSFKAAMKSKCPIVPVAIIDSYKAFDTNSTKRLTVQVHYLKPLYYEDYKDMKAAEIAKTVAERIEKTIEENEGRFADVNP